MMGEWIMSHGLMVGGVFIRIIEKIGFGSSTHSIVWWIFLFSLPRASEVGNIVVKLFPDGFGVESKMIVNNRLINSPTSLANER